VRILALETTERVGSVAAWSEGKLLLEKDLSITKRSAQTLAPAILELLGRVEWRPEDVQLVAVTEGPGSFTGLRVGVATAKSFAYAVGAEVLGIDTLETVAAASPAEVIHVSVAVDAQRGDVVTGPFERAEHGWMRPAGPPRLLPINDWLAGLAPGTAVSGPILRKIAEKRPDRVVMLPESCWRPTAGNVARLAARDHAAGRRQDLWSFVPRYSRRAAAEEKLERRRTE